MSVVTNVILATGYEYNITTSMINAFFPSGTCPGPGLACATRGDCADPHDLGADEDERWWYGGSKVMEANLWAGAFNYLNLPAFKQHLRELPWESPKQVQLIIKEQDDDVWRIELLFEPPTPARIDAILGDLDAHLD